MCRVPNLYFGETAKQNNKPTTKRESSGAHAQTQNNIPQTQVGKIAT